MCTYIYIYICYAYDITYTHIKRWLRIFHKAWLRTRTEDNFVLVATNLTRIVNIQCTL